jgi:hypothetical protein
MILTKTWSWVAAMISLRTRTLCPSDEIVLFPMRDIDAFFLMH